jgi:torulene dioxygenase
MFAFHSINAYEEIADNGHVDIICDLVQYGTMDILKKFYYSNLVSTSTPDHYERVEGKDGVVRYKLAGIPTKGARKAMGKAEQVFIMPPSASGEFATINPANHTKKHHYVYGVCDRGQSSFLDGLVKMDMETQTSMLWSKAGNTPGEPIFVADPTRAEEDAGVVLSVVLDGVTGLSYLLVLDAVSWTEVGRAEVPTAVGFGFHGAHVKP